MITWRGVPDGLKPEFLADITKLLTDSPYPWYVMEGFRSMERSAELHAAYLAGKGPRAAPAGQSAHNYGLAVDVVLDADAAKPGLQPTWDTNLPGWLWLRATIAAHPRLSSGWKYADWPHIERYQWRNHV